MKLKVIVEIDTGARTIRAEHEETRGTSYIYSSQAVAGALEGIAAEARRQAVEAFRNREDLTSGLKVWNGRGGDWRGVAHCYVCAKSAADAVRLLKAAGHSRMTRHELKVYFNAGTWGNPMKGIRRDRGVWIQRTGSDAVERVELPEGV